MTRGNQYCVGGDHRQSVLCEELKELELINTVLGVNRGNQYYVRCDLKQSLLCEG